MRVLLIATFFPPQHAVASLRTVSIASAMVAAGHNVTVLTTRKRDDQRGMDVPVHGCEIVEIDFNAGRIRERLRGMDKTQTLRPDVASLDSGRASTGQSMGLLRRAAGALRAHSGVFSGARMPDMTDAWVPRAIDWAVAQPRWDVVLSSSGPYTTHLVAYDLRKRGHAGAWIADFRDLWTDNHRYRGLFPFTLVERALERQCLDAADLIVTVSDGLAETLQRKTPRPVEVIYNGYDEAPALDTGVPDADRSPETFDIVYTGTIYPPVQDARPLLEAFALLARQEPEIAAKLRLIIVGEREDVWQTMCDRHNAGVKVELRGVVNPAEARRLQHTADALLLLDWNGPQRGVLTAKAFEYLAAQAPILTIGRDRRSSLGELLRRAGRGVHLGEDASVIASQLRDLVRDPSSLALSPDRELIASLSRQRQAARLVGLAEQLVEHSAPDARRRLTPH